MNWHSLRRSRNPTRVIAANGEVQTSEEAQVYVHDLELFVTVPILDDTPAVIRQALRRTRLYLQVGGQWSKATSDREWEKNAVQNGKFRSCCCPRDCLNAEAQVRLHIVTTGLIEYLSESNKIRKRLYSRWSIGKPRRSAETQKQKLKEGEKSSNEKSIAMSPSVVGGVHR